MPTSTELLQKEKSELEAYIKLLDPTTELYQAARNLIPKYSAMIEYSKTVENGKATNLNILLRNALIVKALRTAKEIIARYITCQTDSNPQ